MSDPLGLAGIVACFVEVYTNSGSLKGQYQNGVNNFLGAEFTLDTSGCRDFALFFTDFVDIDKTDLIKIKLFNSASYFFMGVVRKIPIEGSSITDYVYSGYGLTDYIIRANTEAVAYLNKTVNEIIVDIVDTLLVPKTPIVKNAGKIDAHATSITELNLNYVSVKEALDQVKNIAQSNGSEYLIGVDEAGEFFFNARSSVTKVTLVVGKAGDNGIPEYNPDDTIEERSKYFVLDKSGGYVATITNATSTDIYEEKITAPDIDNADITNWATGKLLEQSTLTRTATIEWKIETDDPLLLKADGNIRIINNIMSKDVSGIPSTGYGEGYYGGGYYGGGSYAGYDLDDTLKIVEVKYIVNNKQAKRIITLGSLPVTLDQSILKVRKDLTDLRISLGV